MSLNKSYRSQRAFERDVHRMPLDSETESEIRSWKVRRFLTNLCTMIFWICVALAAIGIGMIVMVTVAKMGGAL